MILKNRIGVSGLELVSVIMILWVPLCCIQLHAQGEYDHVRMYNNKVHTAKSYLFESEDAIDSTLLSIEEYNAKGRRTSVEYYDSLGIKNSYKYFYNFDTIRCLRKSYFRNKYTGSTKVIYNERGQDVHTTSFTATGKPTGTFSDTKYDDKFRVVDKKIFRGRDKFYHQKVEYHKNGNPKKVETTTGWRKNKKSKSKYVGYLLFGNIRGNPRWVEFKNNDRRKEVKLYDPNGNLIHEDGTIYHTESKMLKKDPSTGLICEQVDTEYYEDVSTFSINGSIVVIKGTSVRHELYRKDNGLIVYEKEYVTIPTEGKSQSGAITKSLGMLKYVRTFYEN